MNKITWDKYNNFREEKQQKQITDVREKRQTKEEMKAKIQSEREIPWQTVLRQREERQRRMRTR